MIYVTRHISWLLLLVFGLIITPKELIHEFYGHDDTHCIPGASMAYETHHHHCEILQIVSLAYTFPGKVKLDAITSIRAEIFSSVVVKVSVPARIFFNLRAPPLA